MNEVVIDSNIFLRYLLQDVSSQYEQAKELFDAIEQNVKTGLVSILVVNEVIWILENYYKMKRKTYVPQLTKIFSLERLRVIEVKKETIMKVLENMKKQKFDFTDLYLAQIADPQSIVSFDKDFGKIRN